MKRTLLNAALFAAVSVLAFSCSKEKDPTAGGEPATPSSLVPMTFSAGSDATKTTVSNLAIHWVEGDQIRIFDDKGGSNVFDMTSFSGASAQFEGSVAAGASAFWAVYPAGAASSRSGDVITATIPAVQTLSDGESVASGAMLAVAKSNTSSLAFKNAFSLVQVEVDEPGVQAITVTALGGEAIAGTLQVTAGETPSATVSGSSTVSLRPAGDSFATGTYYIAIAPDVELSSGLSVTLDKGTGDVVGYLQSSTISKAERSKIIDFGKVSGFRTGYAIRDNATLKAWALNAGGERGYDAFLLADLDVYAALDNSKWTPVDFEHNFYGLGHKLYNIRIDNSAGTFVGFFGTLTGNITNVTFGSSDGVTADGTSQITVSAKSGGHRVGIIANAGTEFTAKYVKVVNFVPITVESGFASQIWVGGILGTMYDSAARPSLYYCENHAPVTVNGLANGSCVGGLYGRSNKDVTISGCTNSGDVTVASTTALTSETFIGGIVGYQNTSTFETVVNKGDVRVSCTGGPLKIGGIAGSFAKATLRSVSNEGDVVSESTSGINYLGGITGYAVNNAELVIGESETTACSNSGAISISGAATSVTDQSCIGGIVGYTYHTSAAPSKCTVAYASNSGQVSMSAGFIDGKTYYIGGIGGHFYGPSVTACSNSGKISVESATGTTATINIGGILGTQRPVTVSGCENSGEVYLSGAKGAIRAGGITGHMANAVNVIEGNTKNSGKVWSDYTGGNSGWLAFGGIAGFTDGGANHTIRNVVNEGEVYVQMSAEGLWTQAGGIVGRANSFDVITACVNKGNVTSDNQATANGNCYAGGIVAYLPSGSTTAPCTSNYGEHTITSCENQGTVTAISSTRTNTSLGAGGIAGWSYADITSCTNKGNINTQTNNYAGAIVGVACVASISGNTVYKSGLTNGAAPAKAMAVAYINGDNKATETDTVFID